MNQYQNERLKNALEIIHSEEHKSTNKLPEPFRNIVKASHALHVLKLREDDLKKPFQIGSNSAEVTLLHHGGEAGQPAESEKTETPVS